MLDEENSQRDGGGEIPSQTCHNCCGNLLFVVSQRSLCLFVAISLKDTQKDEFSVHERHWGKHHEPKCNINVLPTGRVSLFAACMVAVC